MVWLGEAALRTDAPRAFVLALLLALGAANGCTTNHDALARQPKAGSSAGGSAGVSGFGNGGFGNTGDQSQGGRVNPDVEPKGDDVLTIVNGVVDAPSVRLCFARLGEDGETQDFVGSPLPELAYAASTVLTQLDGLSFADDVIQPWVISGQLSRLKKLDCEAAVALAQSEEAKVTPVAAALASAGQGGAGSAGAAGEGGAFAGGAAGEVGAGGAATGPLEFPTLRARPVAALPVGTVNIGRSILLVLTGCSGGAAYTDHVETSVCGDQYSPSTPTLEPVIVKLSRVVGIGKVGLQAAHASQSTGSLDVRASGDSGAVSLVFASKVSFGSIDPRPADTRFAAFDLGVDNFNYGLQAVDENGGVAYQEAWSDILAASGLPAILEGRGYTAVFLGPDPLLLKDGWWNKSAFSLIDNDPTRE
jgi:hypothetical protein